MAINKKLINFVKKAVFNNKYANDEILDTSIVFIDDTREIVTHNTTFGGHSKDYEVNKVGPVTSAAGVAFDLSWEELPKSIYDDKLSSDGTYLIQIEWDQAIYTGIFSYKELHLDTSYTTDASIPVINTDEEIVLTPCGYIPSTKGRLYLKLAKGSRTTTEKIVTGLDSYSEVQKATKPSLFIACSKSGLSLGNLVFKFRQLI